MNQNSTIVTVLIFVLCGWGLLRIIDTFKTPSVAIDRESAQEQARMEKITEKVYCTETAPTRCALYRCVTGYLYTGMSPSDQPPYQCTDGSRIVKVREVPIQ